jgi:Protein of Unknown function (DUF2784)
MVYGWLADLVMILHGALLLFFLIGGFLAWRWFWLIWVHLGIVVWNLTIVLLDFGCPVTASEKALRRDAGESVYQSGYIHHYLDGHLWPAGQTPNAERIGFTIVVISYVGLFIIRRRRRNRAGETAAATS